MKKLFLILTMFASLTLDAQYVTTLAKDAQTQTDGLYYYLPRNVIKLELTIEETSYHIGPYAEFASKMLGTTDYIRENKTEIKVKNVDIQSFNELDPNAAFFVEVDEKSKEPLPNFIMDANGIILAIGYDNLPADYNFNCNTLTYNDLEEFDREEVSFIEILDCEVEINDDDDDDEEDENKPARQITKEDKAKVAAEKISNIRNAYFDLVSGSQEVAYGESMKYMANSIKEVENEYVSLFKGKKITNTYKKCFYFTPEKNHANATITCGKLANGDVVKMQFDTKNASANVSALSSEVLDNGQNNKIFYRIPSQANVTITLDKDVLLNKNLIISQFGELRTVSTKNNKILFNPNTGQIVTVSK